MRKRLFSYESVAVIFLRSLKIAMSRALTEMVQSFNNLQIKASEIKDFILKNEPYFAPNGIVKTNKDYSVYQTEDVKEAIFHCECLLEAKGMEVLLLNQTRPEIGLPVVRVVVPGLRHFWNRFAPGRLYDVPYKLGKIPRILKEEELNPNPILF